MRFVAPATAVFLVLLFFWIAAWYDLLHVVLAAVAGIILAATWRRLARRRAAGIPQEACAVQMPASNRVVIRQQLLLGFAGASACLLAVWILSLPASALLRDSSLDEARSRIEHLRNEGAWHGLAQAAERYLGRWKKLEQKRWFAKHAFDAHIRLALESGPDRCAAHFSKAKSLADAWKLDRTVAQIGCELADKQTQLARAVGEAAELQRQLDSLQDGLSRKDARITALGKVKAAQTALQSERDSLQSQLAAALERAQSLGAERDAIRNECKVLQEQNRMDELEIARRDTLVQELRGEVAALREAQQSKSIVKKDLPPGTTGAIHAIDFSGILPAVTLSLQTPSGAPVLGLSTDDFEVALDGEPTELVAAVNFTDRQQPADILLVIDLSNSVKGRPLEEGKRAAKEFLSRLSEHDHVTIITFSDAPSVRIKWSGDRQDLTRTIDSLAPGGETAINDAMWTALDEVERRNSGNCHVILLTDGRDTASTRSFDEVLRRGRRVGAPVFSVGLNGHALDRKPLQALSDQTGGRYLSAAAPQELVGIYRRIAGDIKSRYRLVVGLDGNGGQLAVTAGGLNRVTMLRSISADPRAAVPK